MNPDDPSLVLDRWQILCMSIRCSHAHTTVVMAITLVIARLNHNLLDAHRHYNYNYSRPGSKSSCWARHRALPPGMPFDFATVEGAVQQAVQELNRLCSEARAEFDEEWRNIQARQAELKERWA